MPYEVLSHTAESGIEATADTLPELIGVLATGMFELMAPVQPGKDGVAQDGAVDVEVEVEVDATTVEDLVVEFRALHDPVCGICPLAADARGKAPALAAVVSS